MQSNNGSQEQDQTPQTHEQFFAQLRREATEHQRNLVRRLGAAATTSESLDWGARLVLAIAFGMAAAVFVAVGYLVLLAVIAIVVGVVAGNLIPGYGLLIGIACFVVEIVISYPEEIKEMLTRKAK